MGAIGRLVAVRFRDKRLIEGHASDFRTGRDFFHSYRLVRRPKPRT